MAGTTVFTINTEADFDADITAIDNGGTAATADTNYIFLVAADLTLTTDLPSIDLIAGDSLSIQGDNIGGDGLVAALDGGGNRGFVVNRGSVSLSNLIVSGFTAPGGTGGTPGGGGAIYVGAGASVSTSAVTFSEDSATGGTPAGGAIFVVQGGTFGVAGGSVAGSGSIPGNGIFIQGNNNIVLNTTTVTGVVTDQSGAGLGTGAGTVTAEGDVTLAATNTYTGGTTIDGTLTLSAPGAAGSGPIEFSTPSGNLLTIDAGDATGNTIVGFVRNQGVGTLGGNVIDLMGMGIANSTSLSPANLLTVTGISGGATLTLDPATNYGSDTFVPSADAGGTGTDIMVVQSAYVIGSEADLNAALAEIDIGGKFAAANVTYTLTLTASLELTTDIDAINLLAGGSVVIDGAGFTIDGGGTQRGFFDYAGGLTLQDLTIRNAVASGGAGGAGAEPGGGGAGLGGGLFVAGGGAATLSGVRFLDDNATGGAAGATGSGGGGGGGLGGAGGAGGARDGGGGGIGLGATGGTSGSAGGAGIVLGAAGGIAGSGNRPVGGAGGPAGGGGGAAGTIVTTGSGKGGGGSRTLPGVAGSGGIGGGFGGGAADGSAAGFGGGGANSLGGWGGGGSNAAGGFGGGSGLGGAGGGVGAGGDVFVQQGGGLTIADGNVSGGSVTGGTGSGSGGAGSAFGSGIFLQGNGNIELTPATSKSLTIADMITDEAGSGGSGRASLTLAGAGTVILSAVNSYSGGTFVQGGTLALQALGATGSGTLFFAYGTADALIVGQGDTPANLINGLLPGDTIDFLNIGMATAATPGTDDVLTLSGGSQTVRLSLDPAQNFTGETFHVGGDGHDGTVLSITDVNGDRPPSIAGTGTLAGDDHTPLAPLAGVTVSDLDVGQTETVTVTLSSIANGALSNLAGGSYDASTGSYAVIGNAAQVTAALDGLVFTPTIHQVAPGGTVTTRFSLSATDSLMVSTAVATTLTTVALNDPPLISGVPGTLVEGYWNVPLLPFPAAVISDPDIGASETVTFQLEDAVSTSGGATDGNGTLSLSGSLSGISLTHTGAGIYMLSAASPTMVSAAIDALQFTAVQHSSVPGYTDTYVNTSVSDGIAPAVSTRVDILTGLPIFGGTVVNQTVIDGQTISPFSSVAVTDSPGLSLQGFTITLYDSSTSFTSPTDANGTLSGADLVHAGVGTYTLTPGSTAAVTAELDALVFAPSLGNGPVTTDFVLSAFDGATTADNADVSVTAEVPCFLAGTRILTERGEVPVQELAVGDRLVTLSGAREAIVWIGHGRALIRPGRRCAATPVLVRKGGLGPNVPHRDLRITKGHSLFLDGVLIPAEFLVNHRSILWDDQAGHVAYYHIELARHDVLLAEGAAAESYRDDGNRWLFQNRATAGAEPPRLACAPVVTRGDVVDVIWWRLLQRSGPRPGMKLTEDADLHLLADGQRIDAMWTRNGSYLFALDQAPDVLRVVSRAGSPAELGLCRDPRMLGVALREIRLWQGARARVLTVSDAALTDGFHDFEPDNGLRWTDGDAALPAALLSGMAGGCQVELLVGGSMRYPLGADARAAA